MTTPSGPTITSARAEQPARREPRAERARRLALRLQVRELLDLDAEALAERASASSVWSQETP